MSWHHLEDTRPKARKDYACYLCGRPILKGTEHIKRSGISERCYVTSRMHLACESVTRHQLWDDMDWERHDANEFREMFDQLQSCQP